LKRHSDVTVVTHLHVWVMELFEVGTLVMLARVSGFWRRAEGDIMSREITHRVDRETNKTVQVVSPERLREILDADGDSHDRPKHFGPDDEWDVADEEK